MNDDLGNFPTPPLPNSKASDTPKATPPTPPAFEPTPDIIPSLAELEADQKSSNLDTPPTDNFFPEVKANEEKPQTVFSAPEAPTPSNQSSNFNEQPIMATTSPAGKSPASSLITIILLLVAGIGISGSVFLYSQSAGLRKQLTDITKTLEQQRTTITPTPTPTVIEIPTPTPTVEITPTPTATPSPTIVKSDTAMPLALSPQALKVGINNEPNAQLILIKVENATDTTKSLIKYFFRKDLTTKKYFYVSINSLNESEINDNAIYVNPDNNIPSLNDLVLGNKLGIDFAEAYEITTKLCTKPDCKKWPVNAQFIKSGDKTIWQLTLDPTGEKLITQIDSQTKEVLFKSQNF